MRFCIGFKIDSGLQTNCDVKRTCARFTRAKPEDARKQPESHIYAAGCKGYTRISIEEFQGK